MHDDLSKFIEKTEPFWQQREWIPLLAGSASDPDYAKAVREELRAVCGDDDQACVVLDSFLPPSSLAAILSCSIVNVHPCSYDAYGMTIMECAALAVPSVIASGGHVGASVHVGNGASIEVEMSQTNEDMSDDAVEQIVKVLKDSREMERLGKKARQRALAWDEDAYGLAMLHHIECLQPRARGNHKSLNSY